MNLRFPFGLIRLVLVLLKSVASRVESGADPAAPGFGSALLSAEGLDFLAQYAELGKSGPVRFPAKTRCGHTPRVNLPGRFVVAVQYRCR